jgi:hypothetical protein
MEANDDSACLCTYLSRVHRIDNDLRFDAIDGFVLRRGRRCRRVVGRRYVSGEDLVVAPLRKDGSVGDLTRAPYVDDFVTLEF